MNKSLILGIGLIAVAIYVYRKNNATVVPPTGTSNACGSCQ
jgi:hypothetical protein